MLQIQRDRLDAGIAGKLQYLQRMRDGQGERVDKFAGLQSFLERVAVDFLVAEGKQVRHGDGLLVRIAAARPQRYKKEQYRT